MTSCGALPRRPLESVFEALTPPTERKAEGMAGRVLAVEDVLAAPRIGKLSSTAWAWEFLRRNPDHQRAYRANRPGMMKPITLTSRTRLIRLRKRFREAENWGLLFFR